MVGGSAGAGRGVSAHCLVNWSLDSNTLQYSPQGCRGKRSLSAWGEGRQVHAQPNLLSLAESIQRSEPGHHITLHTHSHIGARSAFPCHDIRRMLNSLMGGEGHYPPPQTPHLESTLCSEGETTHPTLILHLSLLKIYIYEVVMR